MSESEKYFRYLVEEIHIVRHIKRSLERQIICYSIAA